MVYGRALGTANSYVDVTPPSITNYSFNINGPWYVGCGNKPSFTVTVYDNKSGIDYVSGNGDSEISAFYSHSDGDPVKYSLTVSNCSYYFSLYGHEPTFGFRVIDLAR